MFLYVIEGGGVPDSDWNDPLPDLPHISDTELRNLRAAISRDMGAVSYTHLTLPTIYSV